MTVLSSDNGDDYWGCRPFENSFGVAWLSDLNRDTSFDLFVSTFAKVKSLPVFRVEVKDAFEALAAAEVVAIYATGRGEDIPMEVTDFMHLQNGCPSNVSVEARRVVDRIHRQSKLKDRWQGHDGWEADICRLMSRLRESKI